MKDIREILLQDHRIPLYATADPTLSGSERAHAAITEALIVHWDSLDGAQQMKLATALKVSAQWTQDEENAGIEGLGVDPKNMA